MPDWDSIEQRPALPAISIAGVEVHPGDHVRLHPRAGGDILDIALRGKLATVTAIEQDYEDRVHLAVTLDEDPGKDFGEAGKPAHRFFFRPEEVEPVGAQPGRGL